MSTLNCPRITLILTVAVMWRQRRIEGENACGASSVSPNGGPGDRDPIEYSPGSKGAFRGIGIPDSQKGARNCHVVDPRP